MNKSSKRKAREVRRRRQVLAERRKADAEQLQQAEANDAYFRKKPEYRRMLWKATQEVIHKLCLLRRRYELPRDRALVGASVPLGAQGNQRRCADGRI